MGMPTAGSRSALRRNAGRHATTETFCSEFLSRVIARAVPWQLISGILIPHLAAHEKSEKGVKTWVGSTTASKGGKNSQYCADLASANLFANRLILLRNVFLYALDLRFNPRILPQQVQHWRFGGGKSWFWSETATTAPQSIQDIDLSRRKQGFESP